MEGQCWLTGCGFVDSERETNFFTAENKSPPSFAELEEFSA
jgi:hypothetical protein